MPACRFTMHRLVLLLLAAAKAPLQLSPGRGGVVEAAPGGAARALLQTAMSPPCPKPAGPEFGKHF